ncbi:uncharacterized protein LOC125940873 [Dermacentor silvarum]|uniref:uncharacterized protein LOC125940873 n=1 Tax=Dermacentor silvarum TaxID=543639 RepID=UPI002100E2C5|nr:uncharacterized protein LOC125940873 [Dermacentor silvarum]
MHTLATGEGFLSPEMYGARVVVSPSSQSAGGGRKLVYFIEEAPRPPPGALVPRVALFLILVLWFGTIFASVATFWLYLYPKDKTSHVARAVTSTAKALSSLASTAASGRL